jgi:hypothetical protein
MRASDRRSRATAGTDRRPLPTAESEGDLSAGDRLEVPHPDEHSATLALRRLDERFSRYAQRMIGPSSPGSGRRAAIVLVALLFLPHLLAAAGHQDPESIETGQEQDAREEGSQQEGPDAGEAGDPEVQEAEADPCDLNSEGNWIDWMNKRVTKTVCGSSRWFDGFFGTARGDDERNRTFGRIGLGGRWDEDDGFGTDFRWRARLHFPNMDDRFHGIVGRGTTDELLEDNDALESPPADFFDEEDEWLLGFGYRLGESDRRRVSISVGTSFSNSALDPYIRIPMISMRPVSDRTQLHLRLVPQWQETRGAGALARIGLDRNYGENVMVRWDLKGQKYERRFDGVAYGATMQVFHRIGVGRAMRYLAGIWGESGFENQPEDWGLQATFRDSIYKEIFFIEILGGVNFRRRDDDPSREPKVLAGILFELKFGG